ncbi:hypothetical protein N7451_010522 [Penicillium sp. IBT 35674x]|nr:hypothetical protein N7451_010522 [Penicillium sp. IBT 35674x]
MVISGTDREALVKAILEHNFSRQATHISAVGSGKNNFVYRVSLSASGPPSNNIPSPLKFGTQALPADTTEVILRLSDPDANLNAAVRIQNEVAAINLMQKALALYPSTIVPELYGWESADDADEAGCIHGWILQESMRGLPLDAIFPTLPFEDKCKIISQIAQIFKAIQTFQLPDTVKQIGGLGFNEEGDIISGPFTIPMGGPFPTHSEMFKANMNLQLQAAEENALIGGWRKVSDDNLYDRLQKFMKSCLIDDILGKTEKAASLTLIHGDFDIHNMLIDPDSLQITALLDFDFSHISFAVEEFLYSFFFIHGLLVGPIEEDEYIALRKAQLEGFQKKIQASQSEEEKEHEQGSIDWKLAQAWDEELARLNLQRPSSIKGIDEVSALHWFLQEISPPYFDMKRWLTSQTPEQQEERRMEVKSTIERYLERWGL